MNVGNKSVLANIFFYPTILFFLVIQIYPILWIFTSSFKTIEEFQTKNPFTMPDTLYLGNYIKAITHSIIPQSLWNSTVVAFFTLIFIVLLGSMATFAIEKMDFIYNKVIMNFFLIGMMIPIFVTLIPMFQIYNLFKLRNTYISLILPQVGFGLPICIYLFSGFLKYLPNSIIESAVMDGASSFKIYRELIMPLSKNTIITIITFNFIFVWNEFTFANTFLTSNAMKTIPVGLKDFVGEEGVIDWGATFAAIAITVLPTLIVYFILNKNVINGMTAGAVKS